ncbi:MAG: DUF1858 domain-containing protein [Patescibacteria group bacterium]|jgi:hybrid cluster-associated redox disulfide protein
MKIKKTDNIAEVLSQHPEIAEVLLDHGLHCVGCPASGLDTIEKGAQVHGMKDEDVDAMMNRINEVLETGE